jgi:tetratricopeptide (TPR) repeat protein
MGTVSQPGESSTGRFAPFVGSRFFTTEEHTLFHGRNREIGELSSLWKGGRVAILYGEAGVGKSSLLHAGVLPFLRRNRHENVLPVGHPWFWTSVPLAAVPRQNRFSFAVLSSWQEATSPHRISELSIGDFWAHRNRPMVAIDQAELLFRECASYERDRRRFLDELKNAMTEHQDVRLLLSVRGDFLDDAVRFARRIAPPATYRLGPLERAEAIEAVRRPARFANRTLDPGVAEHLVDELRMGPDRNPAGPVEPALLQVVCTRLLTHPSHRSHPMKSAVDAALMEHVAETLVDVAADHRQPARRLADWFRKAFGHPSAMGYGRRDSAGSLLMRSLEDRHLIRGQRDADGSRTFSLLTPRLLEPVRRLSGVQDTPRRTAERILGAARKCLCTGDFVAARWHAERAITSAVTASNQLRIDAEAKSLLGDIAYEERQPKSAIAHYQEAAKLFEIVQDTAAVAHLLAAIGRLMLAGDVVDPATAVAELRAATDRVPNDAGLQAGLGRALLQAGEPQTALAVLGAALSLDGETPEALQTRSEIFADQGDRESAKSALRDLDRVGHHARPSSEAARALALATLSRLDAAKNALDAALAEVSDNGPALLRAARVEQIRGNQAAAVRLAAQAVRAKDPPLPLHQRGTAHHLRDAL